MSIIAYLSPRRETLKMPDAEKVPGQCGIHWRGPVLSGKRSLNQAMNEQETRARGAERLATTNNQQPTTDNGF